MIFISTCAGCNEPGHVLCRRCRFALVTTGPVVTPEGVRAAMPFDGVARHAVLGLKFRNRRGVAHQLAALMVRRLLPEHSARRAVDVVTWAPTSSARIAQRGFDQAELLARAVAKELGLPCRRLLYRTHGGPQAGRNRAARLGGPAFRARPPRRGLRVLLVDDVVTTGATLAAARDSLLAAGITDVQCIAAAATPSAARARRTDPRPTARHLALAS
jgi:predicted amidophosphoribosyltransferase